jgi:hypothetical protein
MWRIAAWLMIVPSAWQVTANSEDIKQTDLYRRLKTHIDSIRLIDTHDHLQPFDQIPHRVKLLRDDGSTELGMTLHSVWAGSYFRWYNRLTPWPTGGDFRKCMNLSRMSRQGRFSVGHRRMYQPRNKSFSKTSCSGMCVG